MNRKFVVILGATMVACVLSLSPNGRAQNGTGLDTSPVAAMKDKSNDAAMRSKVSAALAEDKDTAGAAGAIHVQTDGGVVVLTGDVASQTTAENAQTVVARLAGVRDVVNDLKYPSPSKGGTESKPQVVPPQSDAGISGNR
jgi:osmotically-inducible protein OsmY